MTKGDYISKIKKGDKEEAMIKKHYIEEKYGKT